MERESKIFAIVGMCGSGKSVVSDYLVQRNCQFLRFGQITIDEVKRRGVETSEELEREIREGFREEHGMAAYAILNKPKIDSLLMEGDVVVDGLYSWSEYKVLKETYGDRLVVISVMTSPDQRYDRLAQRKVVDKEMRNRPLNFGQAKSRDYSEIENIEKGGPIAMADIILINNATVAELISKLREGLSKFGLNYVRPTWDDYFMEIARSVAKRATCDRGRSGCVIARDKQVLVSGYVGAPKGLPHCDDVGHQMKSVVHEDGRKTNHCVRTTHAEQNAICQAAKLGVSINGSTLYCRMTPCTACAKMIINAGIKRVVCEKRYHEGAETEGLFSSAGVIMNTLNDELQKYENQ